MRSAEVAPASPSHRIRSSARSASAVVIHESLGLDDNIGALSDRLAGMGYLTLAPDFYDGGTWWR